jgi:all-trans-retinol 13,14-reductase
MPRWLASFLVQTGLVYWTSDWFKYCRISSREVIESLTNNNMLRTILTYNSEEFGTVPRDAPFALLAALYNHFMDGASFPSGGSSEIGFHIVPTIVKAGGAVFVRAEVAEILIEDEVDRWGRSRTRAVGVRMKRDNKIIRSPLVISAAGLYNTAQKLLPSRHASLLGPSLSHVRPGIGGVTLFVGLKGTSEELGIENRNYWTHWTRANDEKDLTDRLEAYIQLSASEAAPTPAPLLFITFPSAKDPLWEQRYPNKSTCIVITFGNFEWFSEWESSRVKHRGTAYEDLKKKIGDILWKQTLASFPQLQDKVEFFDVGTPITNNYYLAST